MSENEIQLFRRFRDDDESAFKVIYNKYFPRLYYFIFEFIPLNDITENIVQDTLFTFWNKRKDLKDDTNIGAYLFTVAKNNCLYNLRSQRYRENIFASKSIDEAELDLNIDVLTSLDSSPYTFDEIHRIINETLEELPPQCKRVFTLSRFQELKNREIADELNISVKVVEKHITKALKIFKQSLNDYLPYVAYLFF